MSVILLALEFVKLHGQNWKIRMLLIALFESMRFRPRAVASQAVNQRLCAQNHVILS